MLEEFHYDNNSGLCASDDPAFQTWIGEIPDRVGDDCSASKDGRAALTAFYNATGGANWGNNTNWLSDRTLGDWYGVTTDTTGRVVALDLFENHLTGTIPSEVGNLANLTRLNLRDNQLTGTISAELSNLINLVELDLNSNQLSGTIPAELGNLANLQYLILYNNELNRAIPTELGKLTRTSNRFF